jgi:hypothetical protein
VRILSETASARLATPVNIKYEDLRSGLGYDVRSESATFSPIWLGGEWRLRDITNYMTTAAFSLLKHASDNREKWLSRFYAIGKEAVRPRKKGELYGFLFDDFEYELAPTLQRAGVEVELTDKGFLVPMAQPYGSFAKAILEKQTYPNLKDEKGNPIPPYDVTAHTLSLLMGIEAKPIYESFKYKSYKWGSAKSSRTIRPVEFGIYKSYVSSMDEGWTRWIVEQNLRNYTSLTDKDIRAGNLTRQSGVAYQDSKQTANGSLLPAILFP